MCSIVFAALQTHEIITFRPWLGEKSYLVKKSGWSSEGGNSLGDSGCKIAQVCLWVNGHFILITRIQRFLAVKAAKLPVAFLPVRGLTFPLTLLGDGLVSDKNTYFEQYNVLSPLSLHRLHAIILLPSGRASADFRQSWLKHSCFLEGGSSSCCFCSMVTRSWEASLNSFLAAPFSLLDFESPALQYVEGSSMPY